MKKGVQPSYNRQVELGLMATKEGMSYAAWKEKINSCSEPEVEFILKHLKGFHKVMLHDDPMASRAITDKFGNKWAVKSGRVHRVLKPTEEEEEEVPTQDGTDTPPFTLSQGTLKAVNICRADHKPIDWFENDGSLKAELPGYCNENALLGGGTCSRKSCGKKFVAKVPKGGSTTEFCPSSMYPIIYCKCYGYAMCHPCFEQEKEDQLGGGRRSRNKKKNMEMDL